MRTQAEDDWLDLSATTPAVTLSAVTEEMSSLRDSLGVYGRDDDDEDDAVNSKEAHRILGTPINLARVPEDGENPHPPPTRAGEHHSRTGRAFRDIRSFRAMRALRALAADRRRVSAYVTGACARAAAGHAVGHLMGPVVSVPWMVVTTIAENSHLLVCAATVVTVAAAIIVTSVVTQGGHDRAKASGSGP